MLMREASARLGECDRTFCESEALLVRRHSGCALVRPSVSHGVHSPHVRGFRPVAVGGRRRLGNAATGFRVHSDQHAGRVLAKKRSPRVWAGWWVLVPRLSRSERVRRVLQPGYRAMASPAGYECRAPRLVHGSAACVDELVCVYLGPQQWHRYRRTTLARTNRPPDSGALPGHERPETLMCVDHVYRPAWVGFCMSWADVIMARTRWRARSATIHHRGNGAHCLTSALRGPILRRCVSPGLCMSWVDAMEEI
jgi:hypothetical protein